MIRKRACRTPLRIYERLEQRQLLASISFDDGTLVARGNDTDDVIKLVGNEDAQSFTVNINSDPNLTETFAYADVTQLTVFAGSGNDRVTNTLRRDSLIYGGAGNDFIEGGYKNDFLFGGDGNDVLVGRNGDDILRGQSGIDWIYGGPGTDRLFGLDGSDRIFGGPGNDFIQGDSGNDELYGQAGDDRLFGGADDDRLFGGLGNDQLAGHDGNDVLIGGLGDDLLVGNAGNDLLNGNEDNDTINAGPGDDTVNGGTGDDVIVGFDGMNFLNGNGGDDRISGGKADDNIQGGSGNDFLAGNEGQDVLIGGFGDDHIEGNAGNDLLNGNDGNDTVNAGQGDDTVNGGQGDDLITGFDGTNVLNGNGGNDRIYGGKAVDNIQGGSGDDFLAGNEGQDVLLGGLGDDRLFGGRDDDQLNGQQGNDFIYGQQGNDEIYSSLGDDRISGNDGSDLLYSFFQTEFDFRVDRVGANYRVTDLSNPDAARADTYGIDILTSVETVAYGGDSNEIVKRIDDTVYRRFAESSEVVASINDVLPDDWKSKVRIVGDDIWLRTVKPNGSAHLDFRFGSAGVIAEIRDVRSGRSMLAPSFRGELTDRVVQWTMWEAGPTVRHDVPSLTEFEDRFNMTQAGTFRNVLSGTVDVDVDAEKGQVDVWSVVDHNWRSEQDPHMDGTITALTRTQILDGGAILVRRVLRIGEIRLNGKSVSMANPFFEAWTPFSDSEFDSIALSIDASGRPNKWFADGKDIPRYAHTNVRDTRGWAMSFDRQNPGSSNNLAVVFGTEKGTVVHANGSETAPPYYQLNMLDFEGGMGILPALFPGRLDEGAIIDQHLILMPGSGISSATPQQLDALADVIPAPRVFHAGAELEGELLDIANRLTTLTSERRVATDNIAGLR